MAERVRVLIVDDSSFYRKRIIAALSQSPEIEIIGEGANGEEALRLTKALTPDLVTMDIAMPIMDGIEAVGRIMAERPTPILMFSALTREGARATLAALDAGAVDFVPKIGSGDQQSSAEALRQRVLEVAASSTGRSGSHARPAPADIEPVRPAEPRVKRKARQGLQLVVIGASTGGPVAVQKVLAGLRSDFPLPVLVGIHMPAAFTATYAERLNAATPLPVSEAQDGSVLRPGEVLIAPGGQETRVISRRGQLMVSVGPGQEGDLYRPSIDTLLASTAESIPDGALGIVMTGMGADGARGAAALRRAGGRVWAQDQASCVVYGMPRAVADAGLAENVLALEQIAPSLLEEC